MVAYILSLCCSLSFAEATQGSAESKAFEKSCLRLAGIQLFWEPLQACLSA